MSRQLVPGSADWVEALRDGALDNRYVKRPKRSDGLVWSTPLAKWHGKDCPYCRRKMEIGGHRNPTRDHIHPRSRGGRLSDTNRLIVCSPCNGDKGDMTLEQWATRLTKGADERAGIIWNLVERHHPARAAVIPLYPARGASS